MSVCPQIHLTVIRYSSFFDPDPGSSCFGVSHYGGNVSEKAFREVVKTTVLEQDPPNPKRDGGLCLSPLPPPQHQKMVSLLHSHPSI